ncbi:MAG TPA: alternative ribosome rescue aminoacyl-tRNA hydrolase ArfB [Caulobacteraceae bacterium]|jgi:ribosome-associated protein|nr:alternative ribosome rescue aminoacyl-tRNA hydrolase ArfB [Caulobacteraceae bacterium]
MIPVTDQISLDEAELQESFLRASGPGGQNVNKVATAVQLRFDAAASASLAAPVKDRLRRVAGRKMTEAGVIVITANRFRTQERNRSDAVERLVAMIAQAAHAPVPRRPTRPTYASRQRRLEDKKKRSEVKTTRSRPSD